MFETFLENLNFHICIRSWRRDSQSNFDSGDSADPDPVALFLKCTIQIINITCLIFIRYPLPKQAQ